MSYLSVESIIERTYEGIQEELFNCPTCVTKLREAGRSAYDCRCGGIHYYNCSKHYSWHKGSSVFSGILEEALNNGQ